MALGAITTGGVVLAGAGRAEYPSSVLTDYADTLHDSLAATASTATVLKTPLTASSTNMHLVRVPQGAMRIRIRCRYVIAMTAVSTMAKVQLYSIFDPGFTLVTLSTANVPTLATDGTLQAERIDAQTIAAAATTVPCAPGTDTLDASFGYGDPAINTLTSGTSFDLNGGAWVLALVQTAAVVSGGAGAITLRCSFLN